MTLGIARRTARLLGPAVIAFHAAILPCPALAQPMQPNCVKGFDDLVIGMVDYGKAQVVAKFVAAKLRDGRLTADPFSFAKRFDAVREPEPRKNTVTAEMPFERIPKLIRDAYVLTQDPSFESRFRQSETSPGCVEPEVVALAGAIVSGDRIRQQISSRLTQMVVYDALQESDLPFRKELFDPLNSVKQSANVQVTAFLIERSGEVGVAHILGYGLNRRYFGPASQGILAASVNYFDKPPARLTIGEVAYLMAVLGDGWSSGRTLVLGDRAIPARNRVIDLLAQNGAITAEDAERAKAEPLVTHIGN